MRIARSGYAFLAILVTVVGLFTRPFYLHRELPSSAQTREALWAFEANPTPENKAVWVARVKADVANNDRQNEINYLQTYFAIIAAMWGLWGLWWFADKKSPWAPGSKGNG